MWQASEINIKKHITIYEEFINQCADDDRNLIVVRANYETWKVFVDQNLGNEIIEDQELHILILTKSYWDDKAFCVFDREGRNIIAIHKTLGLMLDFKTGEFSEEF